MARRRRVARVQQDQSFKGRQYTAEVILWAVRWYLMFPISYRDLELMLADRGVEVRSRASWRMLGTFWRQPHPIRRTAGEGWPMTERVERSPATAATVAALGDSELVTLAGRGDAAAFREIMRRNSRQLFRAARAILRDDVEAEDALQEVYLRAFQGLAGFRGESSLSTWLTRIALNEALGRLRQRRAVVAMEVLDVAAGERQGALISPLRVLSRGGCSDPEGAAGRNEVRRSLKQAIEELPEPFRVVFVLRDVKEASVEKTAVLLGLRPETVRTRLHRARRMLRASLDGLGKAVGPILGGPDGVRRPSIVLSARDHKHLIVLAGTAAKRSPQVARLLMEETSRADVVSAEQLPMDVVAVGSLVKFHDAVSQVTQQVQLALPDAANIGEGRISVLSLVGAGLIGLATGQSIDWPTQGGRMRRLSVLRVDPAERSAAARFPSASLECSRTLVCAGTAARAALATT